MINKKIGLLQISTLTFFLTITSFILFSSNIIKISKSDTIISIIISSILSLFILKIILSLRKKFKLTNEINKIFITIILITLFIYLLINITNFIKVSFLSNGNFYSIIILIFITTLIISNQGYKEVASLSLILSFIFIPLFIINIYGSTKTLDLTYLTPIFTNNIIDIIKASLLLTFYITVPLLLLLFIPYNEIDNKKNQDKYLYLAFSLGILTIIIEYLLLYFSCNIEIITSYKYPFMLVINSLSSFLIFNRFSYIISFYLLFSPFITLSLILTIIRQLKLNKYILKIQD